MYFQSEIGKIYYEKVGHGPHLSFLHGFCEDHRVWKSIYPGLSKNYSCLLVDLPGFGLSALDIDRPSIKDYAYALHSLYEFLEIKSAILIGHSMGGYIAAEFLHQFPEQSEAIAFIHSTSTADSKEKKESRKKVIEFVKQNGAQAFLKQFYPALVAGKNLATLKSALEDCVKLTSEKGIIAATYAMMNRNDHQSTLQHCSAPVLFLTGTEDNHFSQEQIYQQAAACTLAQIEVLEGVGHLSMLEAADTCYEKINSFLSFTRMIS